MRSAVSTDSQATACKPEVTVLFVLHHDANRVYFDRIWKRALGCGDTAIPLVSLLKIARQMEQESLQIRNFVRANITSGRFSKKLGSNDQIMTIWSRSTEDFAEPFTPEMATSVAEVKEMHRMWACSPITCGHALPSNVGMLSHQPTCIPTALLLVPIRLLRQHYLHYCQLSIYCLLWDFCVDSYAEAPDVCLEATYQVRDVSPRQIKVRPIENILLPCRPLPSLPSGVAIPSSGMSMTTYPSLSAHSTRSRTTTSSPTRENFSNHFVI